MQLPSKNGPGSSHRKRASASRLAPSSNKPARQLSMVIESIRHVKSLRAKIVPFHHSTRLSNGKGPEKSSDFNDHAVASYCDDPELSDGIFVEKWRPARGVVVSMSSGPGGVLRHGYGN